MTKPKMADIFGSSTPSPTPGSLPPATARDTPASLPHIHLLSITCQVILVALGVITGIFHLCTQGKLCTEIGDTGTFPVTISYYRQLRLLSHKELDNINRSKTARHKMFIHQMRHRNPKRHGHNSVTCKRKFIVTLFTIPYQSITFNTRDTSSVQYLKTNFKWLQFQSNKKTFSKKLWR